VREEELKIEIARVHEENLCVYGADKVWAQLNREGTRVARCTIERLMGDLGLSGARRGKAFQGHHPLLGAPAPSRRPLVDRDFTAEAPNRLWVADLTCVKTHSGWVYAAFIVDVFSRMVVGWQLSNSLRSDLAIDALEMAVWNRTRANQVLDGLVHHSDKGVQYLSIRYSERLAANDIVASVGSTGDSYDNAMAEAFNSLSTRRAPGPASTTSSSPPWATSTGSTTVASTARSPTTTPTSLLRSSRPSTTVRQHPPSRRSPNSRSSHETRGGSHCHLRASGQRMAGSL